MTAQQFVDSIESYRAQLFAQACRLVRQEADAHVLVQDTISHAFINRTAFRQDINLLNWLRTLMRNLFFTEYRRNQHRRRLLERYPITAGHTYNVGEHSLSIAEADALVKSLSTPTSPPPFACAWRVTRIRKSRIRSACPWAPSRVASSPYALSCARPCAPNA